MQVNQILFYCLLVFVVLACAVASCIVFNCHFFKVLSVDMSIYSVKQRIDWKTVRVFRIVLKTRAVLKRKA